MAGTAWWGTDCPQPAPAQECHVFTAQELEHQVKLAVRFKASRRKWWFVQQALDVWNLLPEEVAGVKSLHEFRRELDTFAKEKASEVY